MNEGIINLTLILMMTPISKKVNLDAIACKHSKKDIKAKAYFEVKVGNPKLHFFDRQIQTRSLYILW